ncbi:hypothetical protein B0H19DRAFT_1264595 [Mycena capillaripes]|nr:hypothetical protein B0H19DRAFT_1264595 [Mycena capillaripes]
MNEWRASARVPQRDAPVRSDAHTAVLRAETEDFHLILEEGLQLEEEDEEEGADADTDNQNNNNEDTVSPQQEPEAHKQQRARSASTNSTPASAHGPNAAGVFYGAAPAPIHGSGGRFAFETPLPLGPPSPSSSGGWDGPPKPPASAGAGAMRIHTAMGAGILAQMHLDAAPMKEYFAAAQGVRPGTRIRRVGESPRRRRRAWRRDGDERDGNGRRDGNGNEMSGCESSHPAFHVHQQQTQQAIRVREMHEQQQAVMMGGVPMQMGMHLSMGTGMGMGMQMGTGMGMGGGGLPFGVAPEQYLHQPARC